jgi:hypothetical protein
MPPAKRLSGIIKPGVNKATQKDVLFEVADTSTR